MLFGDKKWLIWCFLKISVMLDFVTKLILENQRNPPENSNKETI